MAENFEILDDCGHVRLRPGMYVGSTSLEEHEMFVSGKWQSVRTIPAIMKMVDEIVDNSVDEAIRTNYKFATKIKVSLKGNKVEVEDNGRGIPIEEVKSRSGETYWRPEAAWCLTKAGTSFTENRETVGTNGLGSSAVNYLSHTFLAETWSSDGYFVVNTVKGQYDRDMSIVINRKTIKKGSGTRVVFTPDSSLFNDHNLEDFDAEEILYSRLLSLAVAHPKISFVFNGKAIRISFENYAKLHTNEEEESHLTFGKDEIKFFVASAEEGKINGFVNGVNTRFGGTYTDFIYNGIVDALIPLIKKKHKVDITKTTIKGKLVFVSFVSRFTDPMFDGQTKERLTNSITHVRKHWEQYAGRWSDFEKMAKAILVKENIIEPIVAAEVAKLQAAENRKAKKAQKELRKARVAKHVKASGDDTTLFVCEGLSAIGFALDVRDPKKHGFYPLKGVTLNAWTKTPAEILKNKELAELVAVLNLDIHNPNSVDNLSYSRIALMTDADSDGAHILLLLMAFFYRFWPRLFDEDMIMILRTPVLISKSPRKTNWCYTPEEAKAFKAKEPKWKHRYIKGLASLMKDEYKEIINNPKFDVITVDNPELFEVMFGDDADARKDWVMGKEPEYV